MAYVIDNICVGDNLKLCKACNAGIAAASFVNSINANPRIGIERISTKPLNCPNKDCNKFFNVSSVISVGKPCTNNILLGIIILEAADDDDIVVEILDDKVVLDAINSGR